MDTTKVLVPVLGLALFVGCPADDADAPLLPGDDDDTTEEEETFPYITDDQGRVLILHGMNTIGSSKHSEGHMPPMDEAVIARMADDWGFNVSRFLIFWDLLEPRPGEINDDYLDAIEPWLDLHHDAGMLVILDMHQDVYSEHFCCDGAPKWAIRDDGESFELQGQWWANYMQPAVMRAFDNFWLYTDGDHADLQDHYAEMWAAVAARFKDHPAVLGYDIMNEPHPGSAVDVVELLGEVNPGSSHEDFDQDLFQPFYQRMIDRIRLEDPDGWIFYEPRYGAPGNGMPSYMGVLDDPRDGGNRLGYFPHIYSLDFELSQVYDSEGDDTIPSWEQYRLEEAAAQNCPMLIGEWGFDSSWDNADQAYRDVLAMSERSTLGFTYWSLDPGGWGIIDGDWNEKSPVEHIVRTYPRAVAGVPVSRGFDPDTRDFFVEFITREGVTGPTEIYIPAARHYPDGWTLTVDQPEDSWSVEWDEDRDIARVTTTTTGTIRIEVRATDDDST